MPIQLDDPQRQRIRAMVEEVGRAMVAKDLRRVAEMTASWLPEYGEEGWRQHIEQQLSEMASEWGLEGPTWPTQFEVDSNSLSFEELVALNRQFPKGLDGSSFRQRMHLTLMPDEGAFDFDYWCRWWLAVVEENGLLKIGAVEVEP